ncbi:hypothetical protein, partial [Streptomyces sp. NPDC055929]|uniref:hypothetical protein n=1 Tax=Streptomyces sp. NPDC055929 TaxID=3345662 RepID=UPI0035DA57EC
MSTEAESTAPWESTVMVFFLAVLGLLRRRGALPPSTGRALGRGRGSRHGPGGAAGRGLAAP